MNLQDYNFPKVNIFDDLEVDDFLLEIAKERGFYDGNTPYNDLFSNLFYKGGKLNFKDSITSEFKEKAIPYLEIFMQSFSCSHEEKEAVCALILSELCIYPTEEK